MLSQTENDRATYLRVRVKRDEYRVRNSSANLSNLITPQQDIDGRNAESFCKAYEQRNNLPTT